MYYTISKKPSSNFYTGKFCTDKILSLDWTDLPANQISSIGPFIVDVDLFIDRKTIINSYFQIKVSLDVFPSQIMVLLHSRVDKNNFKISASIEDIASALIFYDVDKSILYAELEAFGYKYDVILWQFSELI